MPVLTNGFRVSFSFRQLASKDSGWTENYWNNFTDISQVVIQANILKDFLQATKGNQSFCKKARISSVVNFRQVEPIKYPAPANVSTSATFDSDYPTNKIQLKLSDGNKTVNQWMGGIEDRQIARGGFYVPVGININDMNALFNCLTSGTGGWSLYGLTATPKTPISGFDPATGIVTTAGAHALVNGDRVRISRGRGNLAINGLWTITLLTATTFSLNFWIPSTVPITKSKIIVQKQDYGLTKITRARAGDATSHAVGRPTDLAGGHRKRKRS